MPCSLCSTGMYVIGVSIGGGAPMCPVLYVVQVCMYVIGVSIGGGASMCPVLYVVQVCDRGQHKGWCSHVP